MNYNYITDYKQYSVKKASSGIGFLVFASFAAMLVTMEILLYINNSLLGGTVSSISMSIISIITSICSMFIVGLFYSSAAKIKLSKLIPIKKVSKGHFIPFVLIATAVSMVSNYMTDILITNLSIFGIENNEVTQEMTSSPIDIFLTVISVAILPPLTEEFLFRGIILNRLKPYGINFAIITSSLLFGLMHGNIVQIPFAFVVGLAFAFITVKSGSILPSMVAHFLVNFSSVLVDAASIGDKTEDVILFIYLLFVLIIVFGGIIAAYILSKEKAFFRIYADKTYDFRTSLHSGLTSVGMIFAFIVLGLELVLSTEICGMSIL